MSEETEKRAAWRHPLPPCRRSPRDRPSRAGLDPAWRRRDSGPRGAEGYLSLGAAGGVTQGKMSGLPGARPCPGRGEAPGSKSPLGAQLREPLTEARFQQLFGGAAPEPPAVGEPGGSPLCGRWGRRPRACSRPGAWRLLRARLPPLRWLPLYRWRAWLLGDAVAGVTVGIVHVPQGMAFALLTSVPPVFGLYTSFFPVLLYTLLGTGRHVSTGTFAVLSLMTGSAVERLVPEPAGGNLSAVEREQLDAQRVGAAAALAFGSGALMLGMFALQLGVLATFLSEPVVKALTSGAALHVLVSQLPSLLGLPLPRQIGCFALFKTLAAVLTALPQSSPAELTISVLSLALLVPVKELNVRFRDRLPTPIPGEIVMVLLATVLCFSSSLDTRYNVQIVGLLPGGFPQPLLPNLAELPRVLADSLPLALVTFAVSASLASIYADKYSYTIDSNQELLAHGVSNLVSSLFSCFPNSATLATTSLLVDAGGNTQLAGLFSCAVVLSVLLWLGPFFYYLPKAVLACINISSMRQMFFQMQELPQLWRISRVDFVVWMVTWVAVVTLSVDLGLAVGVVFSMMTVVCRTQRVQCQALGWAEGTELYRPLRESHKLLQVPGLCILSYPAPLYFGTRGQFRRLLEGHLGLGDGGQVRGGRLLLKGGWRRCMMSPVTPWSFLTPRRRTAPPRQVRRAGEALPSRAPPGGAWAPLPSPALVAAEPVRAVVLDCSGVTFADAAGAREVVQLASRCREAGIHLLLAQCNASVLGTLTQAGLGDRVGPEQLFVSVQDAAAHALDMLVRRQWPQMCRLGRARVGEVLAARVLGEGCGQGAGEGERAGEEGADLRLGQGAGEIAQRVGRLPCTRQTRVQFPASHRVP
ncbi:solute carrier family 26 member 10 isoform X3 [Sorex araneus]|uniref:solute carrier family 26 member 10 isoform X3 n=1 Tax=Sorex araneus TaxID=42254 RepID=UPI002433B784|nr:solute carrier family 26 member 10 isoform X3 [Sorex araneus]